MASGTEKLETALAPVCVSVGVELVDVELSAGTLQVTVERAEGIDLDQVAEVARAISAELDRRPDLNPDGRYELEVSSPGLERRLRRPEHFQRAEGSRVSIRSHPGRGGQRRVEGLLGGTDESGFSVTADDGTVVRFAYDDVERARTVFDWQAALREGKRSLNAKSRRADKHEEKTSVAGEGGRE